MFPTPPPPSGASPAIDHGSCPNPLTFSFFFLPSLLCFSFPKNHVPPSCLCLRCDKTIPPSSSPGGALHVDRPDNRGGSFPDHHAILRRAGAQERHRRWDSSLHPLERRRCRRVALCGLMACGSYDAKAVSRSSVGGERKQACATEAGM